MLGAGYRFWLRDSSLVAVTAVTVKGAEGPEASRVEGALKDSGTGMSTLDVDEKAIEKAVASFPTVAGVHVDSDFPHGLTVSVESRPPTMLVEAGSNSVSVAGDGTILSSVDPGSEKLPHIRIASLPSGKVLTGDALAEAVITGSAPAPLHDLIDKIQFKGDQGVVITLAGLPVIFGTAERADEKWTAVAATLSDPKLDSLSYLDVRVPDRPAAGGAGETLADAPDPTTIVPADIVPATTDPVLPTVDPAVSTAADPTATVDAATDPSVASAEMPVAPVTDSTSSTDTSVADSGGATATGAVAP